MVENHYISSYPNTQAYEVFLDGNIRFHRRTLEGDLHIRKEDLPRVMWITYFALKLSLEEQAKLCN